MVRHTDRWHQIMLDEHESTTAWSPSMNLGEKQDHLVFDIMGDISFGSSFNVKEPDDDPLREVGAVHHHSIPPILLPGQYWCTHLAQGRGC